MDWQDSNNDALDELLRSARWSEASPQQVENLEQRWRQVRRRQRFVERARFAGAAFTLFVLVGGAIVWRTSLIEAPTAATAIAISDAPREAIVDRTPVSDVAESDLPTAPLAAREANAYELAVVRRHQQKLAAEKSRREERTTAELATDVVKEAVARLVANPDEDLAKAAKELRKSQLDAEKRLLELVEKTRGTRQRVALRLLAVLATRDSLAVLVHHSRQARSADEVFAAIERLCEPQELAELAYRANTSTQRQAWIAAILRREAAENTPVYLALLRHPVTAEDAIAALAKAENAPIEGLFAALGSSDADERLAAARALAVRNDPAVSRRLARIVLNNNARREALVALLMSRDEVASEFLTYARTDLRLWPSVQAVSAQLASGYGLN